MKRSKLQLRLDILDVLSFGLPMKPTQIMYHVNECYGFLMRDLDFLVKQDLIERRVVNGPRATYLITQKGLSALGKYLELKKNLSIVEEKESVLSPFCNDQVRIRGQQ